VLGHSLLSRFEDLAIEQVTLPYINTVTKAEAVVVRINTLGDSPQAIAMISIISPEIRAIIKNSNALVLDMFEAFLSPLEQLFGRKADAVAV